MPAPDSQPDTAADNSGGLTDKRKDALDKALDGQGKKKQTAVILRPYTRFARWFTRSENLFVNWYDVLDRGLAWMGRSYGEYSKAEFKEKYLDQLQTYKDMAIAVPCFEQDLPYFEDPENVDRKDDLAKAMIASSAAARSEDISSLFALILTYIDESDPDNKVIPSMSARVKKSESRGFKHPILGRLLCPIKHINNFDKNPVEFLKHLDNGTVKVRSRDMPSFLWPRDGYDPEQMDANMFRNVVLVMVWKHIFTCPSSALKDGPAQSKTKSSQAKMNKMTSVTPGSIAYACVLFRHSISTIEDWRIEDKLFKREEFYKYIVGLFDDDDDDDDGSNSDWVKDTLEWWNAQVFGTESKSVDDSDNEEGPSTIALIKAQRRAQKAEKAVPAPSVDPVATTDPLPAPAPPRSPPRSPQRPSPRSSHRSPLNQACRSSPRTRSPGPSSGSRRQRSSRSRSPRRRASPGHRTPSQNRSSSHYRSARTRSPHQSSPRYSSQTMRNSDSPSQHRTNRSKPSARKMVLSDDENHPTSTSRLHTQSSPGEMSGRSPLAHRNRRDARSQSPTYRKGHHQR